MNITKFNTLLGTKIALAKSFEKQADFKEAIKLWIEISELTLSFSKKPDLEFSYKHMLLSRTEQIIQHIRDLKNPQKRKVIQPIQKSEPKKIIEQNQLKTQTTEQSNSQESKVISVPSENTIKNDSDALLDENWIDKVNIKNSSGGIVEISAPKEFKIITPHDPNYVEKMKTLSEEIDYFKIQKKEDESSTSNDKKKFCSVCGAEISPNDDICRECGSKFR